MKQIIYLVFILLFAVSCNKKSSSSTSKSSSSSSAKYRVSKVYNDYDKLKPRFQAKAGDNETITVVTFWATWCTQCRKKMPDMVKLDEKYRNNPKVKVLFVNLDDADRQHLVPSYLRKHNIQGEVVSLTDPDQGKWIDGIDSKWNGGLPATLFFKGKHRKFYTYPLAFAEMDRNVGFMKAKK